MRIVPLTSVVSLSQNRVSEFTGERPYLATGSLADSGEMAPELVNWSNRPSRADLCVNAGDICFARMKATRKVKVFDKIDEGLILSTGFAILSPDPHLVDARFLLHVLRSDDFQKQKDANCHGATQQAISNQGIRNLTIPLPPLHEQHRIAAILDKADVVRTKRKAALETIETLSQAIFFEMFGSDKTSQFAMEPIGVLGNVITGRTPPTSWPNMFEGTIPFVTPGDLDSPMGINAKRSLTEEGALKSRIVGRGATFVCCIGATIGKTGMAETTSAFNQQINAIEWGEEIGDWYGLFSMKQLRNEIRNRGASTTLPLLNKRDFSALSIPVPPISLQQEFGALIMNLNVNKRFQNESLGGLENLCTALRDQRFRELL